MKKRILSIFLAVVLGVSSLGGISYAQSTESQQSEIQDEKNAGQWIYEGINVDRPSPQEKYCEPITISANVSGEINGLQYKFVWMRDSWKEWGIIQDFSFKNEVEWKPDNIGKYTLYLDIKDLEGVVLTKKIPYEIIKPQWSYDGIITDPIEIQKKQEKVKIKAITSGNTTGLQYKFVWMRDDWKEWGIVRDFAEENEVIWETPDKSGQYKIYVDIKECDGETITKKIDYSLVTQLWEPNEININEGINEQVYTHIPISATAKGESENLQYKFVWKKGRISEGWNQGWGIIRQFEPSNKTSEWYPKEQGYYTIYVDIRDIDGRQQTIKKEYEVIGANWDLDKLELNGSPDRFVGEKVKLTAVTSGANEGLQYKFVCKRGNDWSDWEVLQDFSCDASIEIPLLKATDYNIYVDIKDQRGVTFDPYVVKIRSHRYDSAGASARFISKGKSVLLYPNITGANGELQFKYVWMKDNWKEWGVLKDFSSSSSLKWTPMSDGTYYIYIDVMANGVMQSKRIKIEVNDIDPNKPMIALTFDDGPGADTGRILDTLEKYNARATFFMLGDNAKRYPNMVKRIAQSDSELGNHSLNHPQLSKLSAAGVKQQINATSDIIANASGGFRPTVMRPPYGAVNSTVQNNVGLPIIMWSVDTLDWQTRNTQKTISAVLNQARDGDIVLMHDIHKTTVEATVQLIPKLIAQGYQLVTVSELAEARGIKMTNGGKYFKFYK